MIPPIDPITTTDREVAIIQVGLEYAGCDFDNLRLRQFGRAGAYRSMDFPPCRAGVDGHRSVLPTHGRIAGVIP